MIGIPRQRKVQRAVRWNRNESYSRMKGGDSQRGGSGKGTDFEGYIIMNVSQIQEE